jgi:arylsulfatase A-like enzyme
MSHQLPPGQQPNIIIILADDHGFGDLGCYGGPNLRSPHIDGIAATGVRLTACYANSPVCSPSRAALLTGCFPDRVGVPGVIRTDPERSWGYFDPAAITLPQALGDAGYHTVHVGKWHLGLEEENHPCRRGFQRFRGFLGDMMDDYFTHLRHGHNYMRDDHRLIDPGGHATDVFTDWAVEIIQGQAHLDQPLFLYLAYNAPHTPIQPPESWLERVRKREPDISEQRARYVALLEHLDDGVGRVLAAVAKRDDAGSTRDTLVIYTSDNGGQVDAGAYNGPLRGAKQEMYEGGIRVPLCAQWPGRIDPGTVGERPVMLMDLFPTVCDAAGAVVPDAIDGRSMWPGLSGRDVGGEDADRTLYWVRREGGSWRDYAYLGQAYHAVRRGRLKLLRNDAHSPLELYDLTADQREEHDLLTTRGGGPRGSEGALEQLRSALQDHVRLGGAVPWQPSSATGGLR